VYPFAETTKDRRPMAAPNPSTNTASEDEIARFAAVADSWWDSDGPFRPLHKLNPARMGYVRDRVAAHFSRDPMADKPFAGLSVLDVGCGGGLLCEPMARLGAEVTGIDATEESIHIAAHHAKDAGLGIDYRHCLPEALADEGRVFDIVLNMEVVEHVPDLNTFLEICATLIKPAGAMAVSTINRTLKALALAKIGAEYVLRWVPAGTHDWRKFVKPSELAAGLRPTDLEITDLKGLSYNPIADTWSVSRDLDVNYLAFTVKT